MLFKDVIGHDGILRKKTRLVVINDFSFVNCMDRLVFMKGRTIADVGTFEELKQRNDLDLAMWTAKDEGAEDIDHLFKGEI
jgi:ABC-type multidrug transport system fused ATPase/permease subunit